DHFGIEAVGRDDDRVRAGSVLEQIQDRLDALVDETDGVDLDSDEPVVARALGHRVSVWTAGSPREDPAIRASVEPVSVTGAQSTRAPAAPGRAGRSLSATQPRAGSRRAPAWPGRVRAWGGLGGPSRPPI